MLAAGAAVFNGILEHPGEAGGDELISFAVERLGNQAGLRGRSAASQRKEDHDPGDREERQREKQITCRAGRVFRR